MKGTFFKSNEAGRVESRKKRDAESDAKQRAAYKAVDLRDGRTCRLCGEHADPYAVGLTKRAEHHHLTYRSAGGEDTTANLLIACAWCHESGAPAPFAD